MEHVFYDSNALKNSLPKMSGKLPTKQFETFACFLKVVASPLFFAVCVLEICFLVE